MEYMTVREAAEKWKISGRLVQKYCSEGRIDGADKFGRSWRIPENAIKPEPIRRKKESSMSKREQEKQILFSDLMPLMNTAFEPGSCKTYIKNILFPITDMFYWYNYTTISYFIQYFCVLSIYPFKKRERHQSYPMYYK